MKIKHIEGDLLDFTDWNVIGHCCNSENIFGAGLAKTIKEKIPEVYEADCYAAKFKYNYGGSVSSAYQKRHKIYNLYGMNKTRTSGPRLNYDYLCDAMQFMNEQLTILEKALPDGNKWIDRPFRIAFPYMIGCGLAGGRWPTVLSIIEGVWKDREQITIVKLPS